MYNYNVYVYIQYIHVHVHCMHIGTPVGATDNHLDLWGFVQVCVQCRCLHKPALVLHYVTFIYMYM